MFIVVGVVGALLLVAFLLFGDFLEGILPENDWITGEVLGAFLAAFGIVGWVTQEQFDTSTGLATVVGIGGGIGIGWVAYRMTRAIGRMATDPTPAARNLVGRPGRVVTAVAAESSGEVMVSVGGQSIKLSAVADETLARGTEIVVVDVISPTRVTVQSKLQFWGPSAEIDAP